MMVDPIKKNVAFDVQEQVDNVSEQSLCCFGLFFNIALEIAYYSVSSDNRCYCIALPFLRGRHVRDDTINSLVCD